LKKRKELTFGVGTGDWGQHKGSGWYNFCEFLFYSSKGALDDNDVMMMI
jgi:hypothetical protein